MTWVNYHSHCNYCDGKGEAANYIKAAYENGLAAYGFSSHAPLPFDCTWSIKNSEVTKYTHHIRHLKTLWQNKIQVYSGMEVDYIPDKMGPQNALIQDCNLDYTIGSIHFVDAYADGTPWETDGSHTMFLKGLDTIFRNDIKKVIQRYFELTRLMVVNEPPDVVGHLDKIKIQNHDHKFFSEEESWYRDAVLETLETIAQAGVMVEVNTRGLYKKVSLDLYPSRWIIKRMKELDIPITLNSDCHHPREITGEFEHAASVLQETGYTELYALVDDQWQAFPFSTDGLAIKTNG